MVRQRTQLINALRAHLAEYGSVAPKKTVNLKRLSEVLERVAFNLFHNLQP